MTGDMQHDATTEFNEALAAGFAARNFDALGPFYTEDATLLPPRGKQLDGRAAASAFWLGVANRFTSVAFTTGAVKALGEAARREVGSYAMSAGDGQAAEGKYVFVWQLVDGEWQIESAIWNRAGETGGGQRLGQAQAGRGQGGGRGQGPGQAQGQAQGQGQRRQGGGAGGYRRGGIGGGGGAGPGGGYRQGGGRPSFQGGGGGAGGGRGPGGGRQGGQGGGQGGGYDANAGLYSNPKD